MFNFRNWLFGGAKQSNGSIRPENEALPFFRHGRDPKCDPEIAHTIVELIEAVASDFDDDSWYWKSFSKRIDEKQKKNYRAKVNRSLLGEAWSLLSSKTWLSLQNVNARKDISTLLPLHGLENIETLVLTENAITDISVLAGMPKLKELHLTSNRVSEITALSDCRALAELEIGGNPVKTFVPLEQLPQLASLCLSRDQLPAFCRCKSLPVLRSLKISGECEKGDPAPDFQKFPEMPELRSLKTDGVRDLVGIERFSRLEDLNLWGDMNGASFSLDHIAQLNGLMTATVRSYGRLDVSPLYACLRLRSLDLMAEELTGLLSLTRLPVLHDVRIDERTEHDKKEAETLRSGLSSWDSEFAAEVPRPSPNFAFEIVGESEFDRCVSGERFRIDPGDGLVGHERDWLMEKIEGALGVDLADQEDFLIPIKNYGTRSHTVVLYSMKAYEATRSAVTLIQAALCGSKNDWVIYLQALLDEGPDADELPKDAKNFTAWVYPDKIVATEQGAAVVSKLLVL